MVTTLTTPLPQAPLNNLVTSQLPNTGSPLKLHFQIPCVFPVFSLLERKFSLCQFTRFVTITYTKLTWQTYPASKTIWKFSQQISKYRLPLESRNLQLEQNKFPVFWQKFKIPCVFPDGIFFVIFPVFPVQWVPCQ